MLAALYDPESTPHLLTNGELIEGAVSEDILVMVIDRALKEESHTHS